MRNIFCSIRCSNLHTKGIDCPWISSRKFHSLAKFFSCIFYHTGANTVYIRRNLFSSLVAAECFSLGNDNFSVNIRCFLTGFPCDSKAVLSQHVLRSMKHHTPFCYPVFQLFFHCLMLYCKITVICRNYQYLIILEGSCLNFVIADHIYLIAQITANLIPSQQIKAADFIISHLKRFQMSHF